MRTIHRYVIKDFLTTFVTTLVVFVFVMSIAILFGASELISRGISIWTLLKVIAYGMPTIISFSIPVSLLTASLLLFGRLSADGEIIAMKACGINIWRIISAPLLVAFAMSLVCVYLNADLVPRTHYARRRLIKELGMESPAEMLPVGQFTQDFPGLTVWIGKRKDNELTDIRIYDFRTKNVRREIRAQRGTIQQGENPEDLHINLYDVIIDPFDVKRPGPASMKKWPLVIKNAARIRTYKPREEDLPLWHLLYKQNHVEEIFSNLRPEDIQKERMALSVEMNKRLALASAAFAFVLLGIPLGIKTHRRESSIGIAMSLFVVFNFYLFIVLAQSLAEKPEFYPNVIVWLPVAIAIMLGWGLVERGK